MSLSIRQHSKEKAVSMVGSRHDCYKYSFNSREKSLILKQGNTFSMKVALQILELTKPCIKRN